MHWLPSRGDRRTVSQIAESIDKLRNVDRDRIIFFAKAEVSQLADSAIDYLMIYSLGFACRRRPIAVESVKIAIEVFVVVAHIRKVVFC